MVAASRRSSLNGMLVFWLVAVTSGFAVGVVYLIASGDRLPRSVAPLLWLTPFVFVCLTPPVLRRLLRLVTRLSRGKAVEQEPTSLGLLRAVAWAMIAWICIGTQVWVLARGVVPESAVGLAVATGSYALAWTIGFLVVIAPAGAGVREGVLIALLAGRMTPGAVVALVLLSRVLVTGVDVLLAVMAGLAPRLGKGAWHQD